MSPFGDNEKMMCRRFYTLIIFSFYINKIKPLQLEGLWVITLTLFYYIISQIAFWHYGISASKGYLLPNFLDAKNGSLF